MELFPKEFNVDFEECCPVCGLHKVAVVEINGKKRKVPCKCKCDYFEEYSDAEIKEDRARAECFAWRSNYGRFEDSDDLEKETMKTCKSFASHLLSEPYRSNGYGLLLYGKPDAGKTFAAEAIADYAISNGLRGTIKTASELVSMAQTSMWTSYWVDQFSKCQFVVIDDLGSERKSEYTSNAVFSLIDRLYSAHTPMVITTNKELSYFINPQSLEDHRIASRILERCLPVEFKAKRSRVTKDSVEKMRQSLEL